MRRRAVRRGFVQRLLVFVLPAGLRSKTTFFTVPVKAYGALAA